MSTNFEHEQANIQNYKKLIDGYDLDERIDAFIACHNLTDKYPARELSRWHLILTRSCPIGRQMFARKVHVNVDTEMFTVPEFFEFCKDQWGHEVIEKLEIRMKAIEGQKLIDESKEVNK